MTAAGLAAQRIVPTVPRSAWALLLAASTAVLYLAFRGQWTLPHNNDAELFSSINALRETVEDNRDSIPLITPIREFVDALVEVFLTVFRSFSWPGLVAFAGALGLAIGGWRLGLLGAVGVAAFGVLGLWESSVDTLALTLASVLLALVIGIPLGILAGRSNRVLRWISPVLDVMQIMPTFAYLAPLALLFLIGPATAAIATMIYAIPPAIRITAYGIRGVSPTSVEAANAMGSTRSQVLRKVQLPMAFPTIVLGINQTMMMALSMVVITVLVDAPGLGKDIIRALQQVDVGAAFDAGIAIVIIAVIIDRLMSALGDRVSTRVAPGAAASRRRRQQLFLAVAIAIGGVIVGRLILSDPEFPDAIAFSFQGFINDITNWLRTNATHVTEAIKNVVTFGLINPIEEVLTSAPWWLVLYAVVGIAILVGGAGPAITAAVCLVLIIALSLWEHSMETLTTVLVATAMTLGFGLLLGVASARNKRFSAGLRPLLDTAQTMPAFVYLIPAVALFGPTRFTGVVAALIYAIPPVIRLTEAGIKAVPPTIVEAATSAGSTPRQLLLKVQLPMARPALLVAANQGIVMVLAMVVVGGLVGAGGLGYDVVAGFARRDFFGEGFAAGIAIVLLGVMLDRITQGAGRRQRANPRSAASSMVRSA
ncbi:MAG TPA: ABC transporter permease subunit [Candidatus Limnocylindrales bacterium]|nr:ABC transporter permease subunit [Candidatus Limnocylindrales bacterium]